MKRSLLAIFACFMLQAATARAEDWPERLMQDNWPDYDEARDGPAQTVDDAYWEGVDDALDRAGWGYDSPADFSLLEAKGLDWLHLDATDPWNGMPADSVFDPWNPAHMLEYLQECDYTKDETRIQVQRLMDEDFERKARHGK